jgi:hypothetical protein
VKRSTFLSIVITGLKHADRRFAPSEHRLRAVFR